MVAAAARLLTSRARLARTRMAPEIPVGKNYFSVSSAPLRIYVVKNRF
jgi:hypothetical protein